MVKDPVNHTLGNNLHLDKLCPEIKMALVMRLDELDLTVRTSNILLNHGCKYVGDLIGLTDARFLRMHNFGNKSLDEIHSVLDTIGFNNVEQFQGWNHEAAEKIRNESEYFSKKEKNSVSLEIPPADSTIDLLTTTHQLKISLVRRVEELGLSLRLQNCLSNKGCKYLGDVVSLTDSQLLRTPNFGRKSLRELHDKLNHFNLKTGLSLLGWNSETAQDLRKYLDNEISKSWAEGTETDDSIEAQNLEDELATILRAVASGRNFTLIGMLWGWFGSGQRTLESVGQEHGITRERVRQIASKAQTKLRELPIPAQKLKETLAYMAEQAPRPTNSLEASLLSAGLTSSLFHVSGIFSAANIFDIDCPIQTFTIDQYRIIVRKGSNFEAKCLKLNHRIKSHSRPHGCLNFEAALDDLEIEEENDRQAIVQLVDNNPNFRWLDQRKKWVWDIASFERGRNRIVNIIRKAFSVTPTLHVSELRRAVNRYHRVAFAPPTKILLEMCGQLDFLETTGNQISTISGAILPTSLSWLEDTLLKAFEGNTVLDRPTLEANSLALGMNRSSFYVMIGYSPIVLRLARGVYAPIGANVMPGDVEANQPVVNKGKRIIDHGWRVSRYIWIAYNTTGPMLLDGLIYVPATLKEFLFGEWQIDVTHGERVETVTINESESNPRISGVRNLLKRHGVEIGDTVVVLFDIRERLFRMEFGNEELLERYQDNEFDLSGNQFLELDADEFI
jgi:hypothetical protein